MDQLSQDNVMLRTEHEAMRTAHQSRVSTMPSFETSDQSDLQSVCDRLQQENQLFQNAIDQWSQRYEEVRTEKEHLAKCELSSLVVHLSFIVALQSDSGERATWR